MDCWTDHRLIVSKCKLHIQPLRRPQGQKPAKRLNHPKLNSSSTAEEFVRDLAARLPDAPQDEQESIEGQWATIRHATANIGTRRYRHCSEHIRATPPPIWQAKKDAFGNTNRKAQKKLQEMQDPWYSKKADEIQGYADSHDAKCFYDALHLMNGPQSSGSSPLLTADGT